MITLIIIYTNNLYHFIISDVFNTFFLISYIFILDKHNVYVNIDILASYFFNMYFKLQNCATKYINTSTR